jgi:hypothetical protein
VQGKLSSKAFIVLCSVMTVCGVLLLAAQTRTSSNESLTRPHKKPIVDQDGQIWISHGDQRSLCGYAIRRSGSLDLVPFGGTNTVPYRALRYTSSSSSSVFHAVLFAFSSSADSSVCSTRFVLIRQDRNGAKKLLDNDYDDVRNLIVGDINGDDRPEIAVEWTEAGGKFGSIDAWSIESDGRVNEMNLDSITGGALFDGKQTSHFELPYTGPGRYNIVTSETMLSGTGSTSRHAHFEWDSQSKAYTLKSVTEDQCSTNKVK